VHRKLLKIVHEVAAVGVMGALASCVVLVATAPRASMVQFAAVRQGIAAIEQWMLVPSLVLVLVSGLLAIVANRPYLHAGWPWLKALLGLGMFEGTFLTVSSRAREAAQLSGQALSAAGDPAQLAEVLRTEWLGLWTILLMSLANIVVAIWRPRFLPHSLGDS